MNTQKPENTIQRESVSAYRKRALGIAGGMAAVAALVLGGEAASGQLYADGQTIAVDTITILGAGSAAGMFGADIFDSRSEAVRQHSADRGEEG